MDSLALQDALEGGDWLQGPHIFVQKCGDPRPLPQTLSGEEAGRDGSVTGAAAPRRLWGRRADKDFVQLGLKPVGPRPQSTKPQQ